MEVLKDLAALEEMIIEVAKWAYLHDHPDRKRSPRGFTSGISLKMTGVGDGSAVPMIALFAATTALFADQNQIYFEQARNRIVRAIDAAARDEPITEYLPESLLGYFDRIGRSLREDESMEFDPSNAEHPGRLTKATRRKLLLASGHVQEMTEEVALRGAIPEADQDTMSFTLQVINGPKVRATAGSQHLQTVIDAFNGYRTGTRVLLHGVARYNRFNRLQSIEAVEHVSLLDPNDIASRLDEFRSLKSGWLNGRGVAPAPEGLDWLTRTFEGHYPDHLPLPYLYPTAEGGVRAEWSVPPYEISLEVSIEDRHGQWHALNLQTDQEVLKDLDLEDRSDLRWLAARIEELAAAELP